MLFDDRLATVLRAAPMGERAARTQYRQLLDLLGTSSAHLEGELIEAAFLRLTRLGERIPADEQSLILREPGLRLRNPRLVSVLAAGEAKPAAAALATARLSGAEWLALIPRLPMVARGFLRHRRDLPANVKHLLDRLGVRDRVLPGPPPSAARPQAAPPPAPAPAPNGLGEQEGIRALLRRIEAFRETRGLTPPSPRLPLGDQEQPGHGPQQLEAFEFTSDVDGRIGWASADFAPCAVGLRLAEHGSGALAELDEAGTRAMRQFQPLRAAPLSIAGDGPLAGEWRIEGEPVFDDRRGHFLGYRGRIRRPVFSAADEAEQADTPGDRMRQVLHELRTPVNAIQGFAEIIQQQLFGAVPNEYRALAAAIAVDAAKLLAGFEEIDRLARLEGAAPAPAEGESDLREVVAATVQRLDGALKSRNSGFALDVSGSPFTVGLSREELLVVAWRVLASLAGALSPFEKLALTLASDGQELRWDADLPATIAAQDDPFAAGIPAQRPAISAGMFGSGFSLRLVRAEIQAAGGSLTVDGGKLTIVLPVLTRTEAGPSSAGGANRAIGD